LTAAWPNDEVAPRVQPAQPSRQAGGAIATKHFQRVENGAVSPIGDFNPLARMPSGVNWSFFGSFVFGSPGFPLSDVPLQDIAAQVAAGRLEAAPSRVFPFDQIHEAHRVMEAGEAGGKMVVVME
jgi:NADPH:quinone reductase-like Zn-dependent oxidoreductase